MARAISTHIKFNRNSYTVSEILFFIGWTVYSLSGGIFGLTSIHMTYPDMSSLFSAISRFITIATCFYLSIVFVANFLIVRGWSRNRLIVNVLFLAVAFFVQISVTEWGLMCTILLMLTAQNINFKKILSFDIKLRIGITLLILILCASGVLVNREWITGFATKHSYGFYHPNTFGLYAITILLEWLCIRYKKMTAVDWIGIIAASIVIYFITYSRTSLYTFIVFFILFVLANLNERIFTNRVVSVILCLIPAAMAFISFLLPYLYGQGNSFVIELDTFLSNRIGLSYIAMDAYGIPLFGTDITFASSLEADEITSFIVDNSYIYSTLRWGFVFVLFIVIAYMIQTYRLSQREGMMGIALMVVFFTVIGFGETAMNNISYNITLVCMFCLVGKDRPRRQLINASRRRYCTTINC